MAIAWDLQAEIEATHVEERLLAGLSLDYEKLFDLCHPRLVHGMLKKAGLPKTLCDQMLFIGLNLRRYIRVALTYGAVG